MKSDFNIKSLFQPRAIAVIGATAKADRVGRIILENLMRTERPIYPVHPSEDRILNLPVYKRVQDLPSDVDLAVIATNAKRAVEVTEECGRCRIPFAIIVAGGFSEKDDTGKKMEAELQHIVSKHGIRILGPNTLGIFVPKERIDTIFVEHGDRVLAQGGGVAFITQSGSVGVEALGIESNIGFGLRAFIGLGNKVDLDEIDFIHHFSTDSSTTCLALYLESLSNGRLFLEAARDASRKKPVVALKAGRTVSAAAAVSSHTGQLAGSDVVVDAAFRQYGIQRVFDEEQLCDAARVLSTLKPPNGNRVAVISPGGGYGVLATDEIESANNMVQLAMAKLSSKTEEGIGEIVPVYASTHNPIDLSTGATDDITIAALKSALDDEGVDIVLCMAFFAPSGITDGLIPKMGILANDAVKPIVVVSQYGPFTNGHINRLYDHGVIGFPSVARGVRAVRWLVERANIQKNLQE